MHLRFSLAVQRRPLLYASSILFGVTKKTSPVLILDSLWLCKEDLSCTPLRLSLMYKEDFPCEPLRFSLALQRRPLLCASSILFGCTKKTSPVLLFDSLWLHKEDLSCTPLQFSLVYKEDLSCTPFRFSYVYKEDLSCKHLRFSLALQRRPLLYSPSILFDCTKKTSPVLPFDSLWLYKEDLSCKPLRFFLAV